MGPMGLSRPVARSHCCFRQNGREPMQIPSCYRLHRARTRRVYANPSSCCFIRFASVRGYWFASTATTTLGPARSRRWVGGTREAVCDLWNRTGKLCPHFMESRPPSLSASSSSSSSSPPRCCVGRESRVSDVPTLPVGGSCAGEYVGDRECSGVWRVKKSGKIEY